MIFVILTVLAAVSIVYCCDIQVVRGFDFFINQKNSMWYSIGTSIIASYIFYIIQVYIPGICENRKALIYLKPQIDVYLEDAYEIVQIVESVCNIDRKLGKIIPKYDFIKIERSDWRNIYAEKIDLVNYKSLIGSNSEKIKGNEYYGKLDNRKLECLQELFRNQFIQKWCRNIEIYKKTWIDGDLIKEYDELKKLILKARKVFKKNYTLTVSGYEEDEMTERLNYGISEARKLKGIARVNIGKK